MLLYETYLMTDITHFGNFLTYRMTGIGCATICNIPYDRHKVCSEVSYYYVLLHATYPMT